MTFKTVIMIRLYHLLRMYVKPKIVMKMLCVKVFSHSLGLAFGNVTIPMELRKSSANVISPPPYADAWSAQYNVIDIT